MMPRPPHSIFCTKSLTLGAHGPSPRKIVFNIPALVPDRPGPRPAGGVRAAGQCPRRRRHPDGGRGRSSPRCMEVSQALAGTLNLQAGLYGALEVLERRCGALRGAVTLIEEAAACSPSRLRSAIRGRGPVRYRIGEGITGGVAQCGTPPSSRTWPRACIPSPRGATRGPAGRGGHASSACRFSWTGRAAGTLAIELPFDVRARQRADGQGAPHRRGHDLPGAPDPAAGEARAAAAGRGEHPAPPGAARALRVHQPRRQQRADAAGVRAGGAGRRHRRHRADPGRERHGQGADRPRAAPPLAARGQAVRPGQLRRAAGDPGRVRAVRPRARARSPARRRAGRAGSSWPTAARSSWTRSAS